MQYVHISKSYLVCILQISSNYGFCYSKYSSNSYIPPEKEEEMFVKIQNSYIIWTHRHCSHLNGTNDKGKIKLKRKLIYIYIYIYISYLFNKLIFLIMNYLHFHFFPFSNLGVIGVHKKGIASVLTFICGWEKADQITTLVVLIMFSCQLLPIPTRRCAKGTLFFSRPRQTMDFTKSVVFSYFLHLHPGTLRMKLNSIEMSRFILADKNFSSFKLFLH